MALKRAYTQDGWTLLDGEETVLTVRETGANNTVTVALSGALRSDAEQIIQDELVALSTVGADIVLDCGELSYMASACQLAMLNVQKRMDSMGRGSLLLRNVPPAIYAEFEKTNLHELLDLEEGEVKS